MAAGVDADYPGNLKVPLEVGVSKGSDKATRGTVDVDGNVEASALLQCLLYIY